MLLISAIIFITGTARRRETTNCYPIEVHLSKLIKRWQKPVTIAFKGQVVADVGPTGFIA